MFSDLKGIQKSKMFITSISLIALGILIFMANSDSESPIKQADTTYATIEPVDNSDSNFKENTITKDDVNFLYYKDSMIVTKNEDMALTIRNVVAYDKKIVVHYEVETKNDSSMVIPALELYVNDIKCKESKSVLSKCTSKGFNNYDDSRMMEVIYKSSNELKSGDEIRVKLDKLDAECELVPYDEQDGNVLIHNDVAFITKPYEKGNYLSIDIVLVNYSCFKDVYMPANSVQIGHERNYIIINNKKLRSITNLKDIRQSTLERTWYVEFDISDIDRDKRAYKLYIPGLIAMDKTDINITITDESEEEYEYVINNSKTSIGNIDIIELGDMKSSQYDCKFLFYLNVNDNKYEYITSGFVADVEQLSVATDITFADYCAYYGEYDCINKLCVYNIKKLFDTDLGYIKINTMNYWLDDESVIDSKI